MEPHQILYLVIITVCIIFSAYFSATETAFSTFNRIRMKTLAEKGNKRAEKVLKLSENYDTLLSTILIGNNVVNILASSLATLLFTAWLAESIGGEDLGATVSTIVMTLVVLTFGEISPKTAAKINPDRFALFSAPIIHALLVLLTPLTFLFRMWQKLIGKIFKSGDDQGMTEEELISIIEEAEEDGGIDKEESTLIKSAIEFNELEVGDIFTPRIDITAVRADVTKEELAKLFSESGYSRIPIYTDDLDNIEGIVYYKDFFTTAFKTNVPVADIVKPVMYVTKTQKINDLLKDLQEKQMHFAVVTDEYGSTAGIVTLEDILEEIVGEIWDEHDEIIEEIKSIGEREYIVSGMTNLEKFYEELALGEVDDDMDAQTVNGWAMDTLGKIPEEGDSFEVDGLVLKVLKMDGRRIQDLHLLDNRDIEREDSDEDEEN
ncbi:MAG: HlyC/CorC family transporter [Clostridia bacterium]|nr:HlyC/CorC family transporter [Clostridia bacterium]